MITIRLKCQCGSVQGKVTLKSTNEGNHVVCYCADCQAFARHLPTTNEIIDEWGGTEIYQTKPWAIDIHTGKSHLRCLRLTPKGLYRWYTDCCHTAVGNTVSAKLPFVGLIHGFLDLSEDHDSSLGPIMGYHKLESATGEVPESIRQTGMPASATLRVYWRILKWKIGAGGKTSPFFDAHGKTISPPMILEEKPD